MSPSASKAHRAFLPSTNAALAELERVSGKPVLIVDDPALQVLAKIRRAGPAQASHLLRLQREGAASDYLITSQCRFLLRGMAQPDRPTQVREKPGMLKRLCSELEALYPSMPAAKVGELGRFILSGLMLQLRSMGPGLLVDRWIRGHCPDLHQAQAETIEGQINDNLGVLSSSNRSSFPAQVFDASVGMNAAYAIFGGDLLGCPHLGVPYVSGGYGRVARQLIQIATTSNSTAAAAESAEPTDQAIIDGWAAALGLNGWYEWVPVAE
ncbi:MAG: hypothetical protein ACK5UG_08335 [Synechococcaceae cyanobacterium]